MRRAFGDAHYFLALLNPRDQDYPRAKEFSAQWKGEIITTRWVLAEVANGLSAPPLRGVAASFLLRLENNSFVRILPSEDVQFVRGFELYRRRADKAWSLTDCISFVVMQDEKLDEALTGDRHFEQAGFKALLSAS
ncbi:MAG TPA: PIN domain-containing protein [Chthoniobacter sp.]|nr:PIN domain-containing protein [Chthoniobacter sp.]